MRTERPRRVWWRLFAESLLVGCSTVILISHCAAAAKANANATNIETLDAVDINNHTLNAAWQHLMMVARQRGWDEQMIFAVGLFVAHTGPYVLMNSMLAFIDHFGFFQRYKMQQDSYPDWSLIKEALAHQFVSHVVLLPLGAYLLYPYTAIPAGMSIFGPLPRLSTIAWQLVFSFVVNDTLFYFVHRLLHHRRIYKRIHKEHHRFHVTIGIAAEFLHPIENIFAGIVPTLIGPFLIGAHYSVLLLWLILRVVETVDTHSGYQFPWSFTQIMDGAKRHDYHHSHNVGMYGGILLFWDWLFGTDQPFLEHRAKLQKKQKAM